MAWPVCRHPKHDLFLALALWNGVDPIMKERMFGLTSPQGNHGGGRQGASVDLTGCPAMPGPLAVSLLAAAFPYQQLIDENA